MLPDLRLLILATVATFFVAAAAGLFASVRVAQDSVVPHGDSESPINRIQSSWPMPETNRAAALQELLTLAKTTPMANVAERIVVPAALTVPPPPSDDSDGRPDLPPLAHEARHEEPTAAPPAEPAREMPVDKPVEKEDSESIQSTGAIVREHENPPAVASLPAGDEEKAEPEETERAVPEVVVKPRVSAKPRPKRTRSVRRPAQSQSPSAPVFPPPQPATDVRDLEPYVRYSSSPANIYYTPLN